MRNQRNNCRILADKIAEKVQEYIEEVDTWKDDPFLWIDGNTLVVTLGQADEDHPGERQPINQFIKESEDGTLAPDYDQIDEYTAGWFDFRQCQGS